MKKRVYSASRIIDNIPGPYAILQQGADECYVVYSDSLESIDGPTNLGTAYQIIEDLINDDSEQFFEIKKLPFDLVESRFRAYVRGKPGVYFNNGRICSSIPYVFKKLVNRFNTNLGYDAIVTKIIYVDGEEHIAGLVNKELK